MNSDEKLKKLLDQQAELAAQIKAQQRKVKEREEKCLNDRRIEIGKFAEKAGVLFADDAAILSALAGISPVVAGGKEES